MSELLIPIVISETNKYIGLVYFSDKLLRLISKYEFGMKLIHFCRNFKSNNIQMMDKLFNYVNHVYVKTCLYFENKEDEKAKKRKDKIDRLKRENKKYEDIQKENDMFKKGFVKCGCCKQFMKPDNMCVNLKDKTDDVYIFKCPKGEHEFTSKNLDKYVLKHGIENTRDFFKCKSKDMVYLNMPVIQHEYSVM